MRNNARSDISKSKKSKKNKKSEEAYTSKKRTKRGISRKKEVLRRIATANERSEANSEKKEPPTLSIMSRIILREEKEAQNPNLTLSDFVTKKSARKGTLPNLPTDPAEIRRMVCSLKPVTIRPTTGYCAE